MLILLGLLNIDKMKIKKVNWFKVFIVVALVVVVGMMISKKDNQEPL